jgi:hypothetical protein
MPLVVGFLLLLGALWEMKLPVVPVSNMPVADMFWSVSGEEPSMFVGLIVGFSLAELALDC